MQRKLILGLMLLCSVAALAQRRDKRSYKSETSAEPRIDLGSQRAGIAIGKRKKPIPEPLAPLPQTMGGYHDIGSTLPAIRVVTAKSEIYTDSMLKNDANLFVMMFNPTCEHCEDMTRALEANISAFKKSHIILMAAPAMGPYLEYFDKNTKYSQYPQIKVGLDSAGFIERTFNYVTLPQINIYNKDRILIKTFSGITTIDSLREFIQ